MTGLRRLNRSWFVRKAIVPSQSAPLTRVALCVAAGIAFVSCSATPLLFEVQQRLDTAAGNDTTSGDLTRIVSFDAQGGSSPVPESKTVVDGESYGNLATTSRTADSFYGWWTSPGASGSRITSDTSVTADADHMLYAGWVTPGSTWTNRTLPSSRLWGSIAYGNGQFVALAYNRNVAATSPDGVTWTERTLPTGQYWTDVTYGDEQFVTNSEISDVTASSP